MGSEPLWIGVDVGQRKSNICVIDNDGLILREQPCLTKVDELGAILASLPSERIGLIAVEAGNEGHLVRKLRDRGFPVAIFESRKASRFLAIRRNKSDTSDAKGLADLARLGRNTVSQVYLKSPACEQLRSRLAIRHRLVQLRMAAEGALRSRLAFYGRSNIGSYRSKFLKERVEAELEHLKAEEGLDLGPDLRPLLDVCLALRTYQAHVSAELEKTAESHPVCQLLMEVPGVGPICALSFYTAIEDPARFSRSADVAAYLGLVPRRYQSGEASRTLGITKTGSKLTRMHLVAAATSFRLHAPDCALKAWANSLRERVGAAKSRVALARKLSIVMLTMWREGSHFEAFPNRTFPRTGVVSSGSNRPPYARSFQPAPTLHPPS